MIEISAKEFLKRLNSGNILAEEPLLVLDEITISESIDNWEHRLIQNCVFKKQFLVENVDILQGFSFEFCEFEVGIIFHNVVASKFRVRKFLNNASLYFHECKIQLLHIVGAKFSRGILCDINTEIQRFNIERSEVGNGGINIRNSSIKESFDVTAVKSESFHISKSSIESRIRLQSLVSSSVSLIKSKFSEMVNIWNLRLNSNVTLNYNEFHDTFELASSMVKGLFSHGDIFKREFKVDLTTKDGIEPTLDEIYFTEIQLSERFTLVGDEKIISKLTIPYTSKFQGVLKLGRCTFLEVSLSGVNEHSKILFKQVVFKYLRIRDFTNFSDITFSNCKGGDESEMEIVDSDLGLSKFNDFSFKSFNRLKFENAFLGKLICSNIQWFEEGQLVSDEDSKDNSKFLKNKRELYRQLKQALKSNGNALEGLEFQAKELKSYRAELKKSGSYKGGDRVIMLVNMTNNYGLNWWKPTWIILLITLFFYIPISVLVSDEFAFKLSLEGKDVKRTFAYFWDNNSLYVNLLNPTRKFSSVYGNGELSNWVYWLDSIQRIILGLFIFQIIKAFRKFVSK